MVLAMVQPLDTSPKKPTRTRERKPRGRGLRTRTGCITCRKRHLKCNEIKPICGPCVRSNQPCVYADPSAPKATTPTSPSGIPSTSVPKSTSSTAPPSVATRSDTSCSRRGSGEPFDLVFRSQWNHAYSINNNNLHNIQHSTTWDARNSQTSVPCAIPRGFRGQNYGENDRFDRLSTSWTPTVEDSETTGMSHRSSPFNCESLSPSQRYIQHILPPKTAYSDVSSDDYPAITRLPDSGPAREAAIAEWFGVFNPDTDSENAVPNIGPDKSTTNVDESMMSGRSSQHPAIGIVGTTFSTRSPAEYGLPSSDGGMGQELKDPMAQMNDMPWRSVEPLKLKEHEVVLLNYFVTSIAGVIGLFSSGIAFSAYLPQLAMHNFGLLNAILAISLCHASRASKISVTKQCDPKDAYNYYHETLRYLQSAMQYGSYRSSDEVLATCLIVASYEMLNGSRTDWERHLQGFKFLQESQGINGESGGFKQAVWWVWLQKDGWAAFRNKRKTFTNWRPTKNTAQIDAYSLAQRSVYLMARAVSYCSQEEIDKGEIDVKSRIAKADHLLRTIDEWHQSLPIEFSPLPSVESSGTVFRKIWYHPSAFGESSLHPGVSSLIPWSGAAIQLVSAARILLLRHRPCIRGYEDFIQQQTAVQSCVNTICGIASAWTDDSAIGVSSQALFIGKFIGVH